MLPQVIEYLLTQSTKERAPFVQQGISQTLVPIFPPFTEITLNVFPLGNDFLDIVYSTSFDPAMVPGTFFGEGQYYGSQLYSGVVTHWWLENEIASFAFISQARPAFIRIRNLSPLNQYYSGRAFFIAIPTEQDMDLVFDALRRLQTSARSEQLATQANQLLTALAGGPAAPQPPIGGQR